MGRDTQKLTLTLGAIFGISFLLNLVWEHIHALLYIHYKGGPITEGILLHATLMDAIFITGMSFLFLTVPFLKTRPFLIVIPALCLAIGIELWALETLRWAYKESMPIVPIVQVGLTPTVQLAILGYISLVVSKKYFFKV